MLVHFSALRAVHILAGALWVGAAVFNALFLIPAVIASGPAGGQVMRVIAQARRLPVFMNTVMLVTLLTGLWLYWLTSAGLNPGWLRSSPGLTFSFGALCAIVTAAMGLLVSVPTVRRIGQLGAAIGGGPPSPAQAAEMGALQHRLLRAARVGAVLVVIAMLAMAMARYL